MQKTLRPWLGCLGMGIPFIGLIVALAGALTLGIVIMIAGAVLLIYALFSGNVKMFG